MSNIEQTLSIIKPDAVERNLTEDIKKIFIENNLKIINSKKIHADSNSQSNYQLYKASIKHQLLLQTVQQQIVAQEGNGDQGAALQQQLADNTQYHLLDIKTAGKQASLQILKSLQSGKNIAQIRKSKKVQLAVIDLGWRKPGLIPALFVKPIQQLSINQFTAPIQAPNGYHILQLIGKNLIST